MKEKRVDRNGKMSLNRYFVDRVKLGLRLIVLSLAILSLASVMGCSRKVTFEQAKQLGEEALEEYCAKENLTRTDFGGEDISPEEKYDWSISYQSNTKPKHILVFYVNGEKIVERHRLIE